MPPNAGRPHLLASDPDLEAISSQGWDALRGANDPVHIVRAGGVPSRLETDDSGRPVVRTLTRDRLRQELSVAAIWFREGLNGAHIRCHPPMGVVSNMLAQPNVQLPVLERIVEAPVFGPDGTVLTAPGYHPASRTYYHAHGLVVPRVAESPSEEDVTRAVGLVSEVLVDFPFVTEADRLNAIAAMLGPFVRALVEGSTPIHLIESPTPGTGKGLLADVITIPATGRRAATITEARGEEEWRKRITTVLRNAPPFVLIDNLRDRLDSAALSAAVTSPEWADRLLGGNELVRIPVRTTWMITGNNPALSSEIARRNVRIRMDAGVERPETRTGFRHILPAWAHQHRGDLVWALLTMTRAGMASGMRWSGLELGSLESWCRTMGGILTACGLEGFLDNHEEFRAESDDETGIWMAFVDAWWKAFQDRAVKAADLHDLARDRIPMRGDTKRDQQMSLGHQLGQKRDRRFGDRFIRRVGTGGSAAWRLVPSPVKEIRLKSPNPPKSPAPPVTRDDGPGLPGDFLVTPDELPDEVPDVSAGLRLAGTSGTSDRSRPDQDQDRVTWDVVVQRVQRIREARPEADIPAIAQETGYAPTTIAQALRALNQGKGK